MMYYLLLPIVIITHTKNPVKAKGDFVPCPWWTVYDSSKNVASAAEAWDSLSQSPVRGQRERNAGAKLTSFFFQFYCFLGLSWRNVSPTFRADLSSSVKFCRQTLTVTLRLVFPLVILNTAMVTLLVSQYTLCMHNTPKYIILHPYKKLR